MRCFVLRRMFVAPTPANTPHTDSSVIPASPDYIIVEVADGGHTANGMPPLQLAPSVEKALSEKLTRQRRMTAKVPGSGNVENVASVLDALNFRDDTPYRG